MIYNAQRLSSNYIQMTATCRPWQAVLLNPYPDNERVSLEQFGGLVRIWVRLVFVDYRSFEAGIQQNWHFLNSNAVNAVKPFNLNRLKARRLN